MSILLVLVICIFEAISFPTSAYVSFYKVRGKNENNDTFLNRREIEKNNNFNKSKIICNFLCFIYHSPKNYTTPLRSAIVLLFGQLS